MEQIVTNKTPRPHGRSAYAQAHTQAQEIGLFDMIADSIQIECLVDSESYKLHLDAAWFLTTKTTWQCTVDKYGRAGTSQCFDVLRFRVEGQRVNGCCFPIGLMVHAIDPDGQEWMVPYKVINIDSEVRREEITYDNKEPEDEMDVEDKIKWAKKLVKAICSRHNYKLAFSGGKDSVVLSWLTKIAGVHAPLVYNNTTIDPPGTINFCRRMGATINQPRYTFLELVEKKGYPTMFRRFCCEYLKEKYIADYLLTGVRKSESVKRNKLYCSFEDRYEYTKKQATIRLHPLLYFTNEDIEYIVNTYQLECHPLYYDHEGRFHVERRLGCIGCPLQGDRGVADWKANPKLLIQLCKAGNKFHARMGRSPRDSYENLVYNLFYSNHGFDKFEKSFKGMFPADPKEILEQQFNIKLP